MSNVVAASTRPRFLFVTLAPRPLAGSRLAAALAPLFPELDMDVLDVRSELKRHPFRLASICTAAVWNGGPSLLRNRQKLLLALYRTPLFQHWVKQLVSQRVRSGDYRFTFQIQSLFDGSAGSLPHFVYTDHTMLENMHYPGWQRWVDIQPSFTDHERTIYLNADTTFVWSTNVARSLEEQYGVAGENIHCVGAGSNVELDCDPVNRLYDGQTILFVGVEWERKGGPVLVEAFRRIKVTRPEARLIIVGCSPNVASDGIEIVGRQPLATLASYYERASIFCMPSLREPFGNAYIEAMTAGLPVVATSIGATPDFVRDGETGYLVSPDNVDELTAALLRLVGQPGHCQRLGNAGRRIAVDEYNWHAVARRIAAVIRSRLPRIDVALSTRG